MIDAVLPPYLTALEPGQRTPCHGQPGLFAPDATEIGARRAHLAKQLCARCPLQKACADWATTTEQPRGIWGGLTPAERDLARRPVCGTEAAWRSHLARQDPCRTCREAHDARLHEERVTRLDREHQRPEGGSLAGYRLELLLGIPTCLACRRVRRAYQVGRPRTPKWYRRAA